ncbi:MAG TPA: DUF4340 domain-containing protein [Candidatus Polarisedimenticolia bacterium]|nr:DUF4340 domain-containing protein [Candidatus Polarisedimenticolia bacterium]
MKLRAGPIAAILLLAGLGVYVWRSEFHGSAEKQKAEETRDRALPFDRAALKAFTLTNAGTSIRLQKEGEDWTITDPKVGAADKEAVEGVLSSLEFARIERRLGADADRKSFGLDPAPMQVSVETGDGATRTVLLGETNPIGGAYYAVLEDGKEVALVGSAVGEAARRDLFSLRDKTLCAFDPWKTTSLTLERGTDLVALEKRDPGGWTITRPIEAPADGPTITELLNALERLRATKFVAETATPEIMKSCGLEPPQARLAVLQEGWDSAKVIAFGSEKDAGRCARNLGRDAIVEVGSDFWPKVTTPLADLRRREAVGLSQYRLTSISVAQDGGPPLVLTRGKEATWTVTGRATGTVKSESVDNFSRALAGIRALAFDDRPAKAVVDAVTAHPAFEVALEQEPDAEGGTPPKQRLLFGAPGKDGRRPMRDPAWASLAWCEKDALGAIERQIDSLIKEAATPPAPPPAAGATPPSASPTSAPPAEAPPGGKPPS